MEKVNGGFKLPLFETSGGDIGNFETLELKLKNH
jgi:hypothetical protein